MSSPGTELRFLDGLVEAMGLQPALLDTVGTTIAVGADRSGSGLASCYQVGRHTVLWCDGAVAEELEGLVGERSSLTDDDWRTWARETGREVLGQAVMKVLPGPMVLAASPSGATRCSFDWTSDEHVALAERLVAVSDADDLDDAELDLAELDELAFGLLDQSGEIGAFTSMRSWENAERFGDIGVLTRADLRGSGWGSAAVTGLIEDVMPAGWDALYRCDPANSGSDLLSAGLGFVTVTSLTAVRVGSSGSVD